jgi:hypothetical protein
MCRSTGTTSNTPPSQVGDRCRPYSRDKLYALTNLSPGGVSVRSSCLKQEEPSKGTLADTAIEAIFVLSVLLAVLALPVRYAHVAIT